MGPGARTWIHCGTWVCKAWFQGTASPCSRWPIVSFTLPGFTKFKQTASVYTWLCHVFWALCDTCLSQQQTSCCVELLSTPLPLVTVLYSTCWTTGLAGCVARVATANHLQCGLACFPLHCMWWRCTVLYSACRATGPADMAWSGWQHHEGCSKSTLRALELVESEPSQRQEREAWTRRQPRSRHQLQGQRSPCGPSSPRRGCFRLSLWGERNETWLFQIVVMGWAQWDVAVSDRRYGVSAMRRGCFRSSLWGERNETWLFQIVVMGWAQCVPRVQWG